MNPVPGQSSGPCGLRLAIAPPGLGAKYRPLFDYLRRRKGEEVVMTLSSVEIVLKTLLPKSASHPEWWSVQEGDHASCSWRAAGFLAELQRGGQSVRFQRADPF